MGMAAVFEFNDTHGQYGDLDENNPIYNALLDLNSAASIPDSGLGSANMDDGQGYFDLSILEPWGVNPALNDNADSIVINPSWL